MATQLAASQALVLPLIDSLPTDATNKHLPRSSLGLRATSKQHNINTCHRPDLHNRVVITQAITLRVRGFIA